MRAKNFDRQGKTVEKWAAEMQCIVSEDNVQKLRNYNKIVEKEANLTLQNRPHISLRNAMEVYRLNKLYSALGGPISKKEV